MKKKVILVLTVFSLAVITCFYIRSHVVFSTFDERLSLTSYVQFDDLCLGFDENESDKGRYHAGYSATHSLEELIDKSDFIARVHYKSREQNISVIETTVDVIEVYKGNEIDKAVIYEPGYISSFYEFLTSYSSTHFIEDNYDYIVFLQNALPEDKNYYNYVNTVCSLCPIKDEILIKELKYKEGDESVQITMEDYNKYDMFIMEYIDIETMYTSEDIQEYNIQCREYENIIKEVYDRYLNKSINFLKVS